MIKGYNNCEHPEYDANEVIPGLWLGNNKSSYDSDFIKENKIKHIIRVMPEFDFSKVFHGVVYLHIPLRDQESCNYNLIKMMNVTSDYIDKCLKKNEPVLIHCKRGHHRSAAITAAYMIKYKKIPYEKIMRYINKLRPCALRRDTCMSRGLFKFNLLLNEMTCKNIVCNKIDRVTYCTCEHDTAHILV